MQSLNRNGVSITQTPGEEKFVKCRLSAFKGQTFYQNAGRVPPQA